VPEIRASTASPEAFEQHLVTGGELLRRDEVKAARVELGAALAMRPEDLKALGLFGLACFRENAFEDALPVYQKLVELRPDDASHRLNLGLVYLKVGQADRALHELGRSRELDPSQQRTVSYLGLAHARRGDYASAFEAFLRAGQDQLALEMEQYLAPGERTLVRSRLAGGEPRVSPSSAPVGRSFEASGSIGSSGSVGTGRAASHGAVGSPGLIELDDDPDFEADPHRIGDDDEDVVSEFEEEGVITRAVAMAVPSAPAAAAGTRVGVGQEPPRPLTDLATRNLIRPEDGDYPLEIGAGGVLIVRVAGRILSRLDDVIVMDGNLSFAPATRHVRGADTGEIFGEPDRPICAVAGRGYLVAAPAGQCFSAVALDDDILYLRESLVHAFEDRLRWENGHVPGASAELRTALRVIQFRGHGCVAVRSRRPLLSLKLASDRTVRVEARVLAGWIGRVVPRMVGAPVGVAPRSAFVECTGEGVVLLEDQGGA
jgi:uncharacterized protein (AIM24 family)